MKKRILVLFLCLIFAISAFIIPASAAEAEDIPEGYASYNGVVLPDINTLWTDKDTYPYAFIYVLFGGSYDLRFCSDAPVVEGEFITGTGSGSYLYSSLSGDSSSWSELQSSTDSPGGSYGLASNLVWSSFDFINSEDGSVYFSGSDPVFMIPPAPILPGRLEGVQMTEVLKQIVMILPIVLVCLVGWIALRKGLALLVQLLRKA